MRVVFFLQSFSLIVFSIRAQNCDFSDLHISDCQWQASRSEDASPSLQWQVYDEATLANDPDPNDSTSVLGGTRSPSSLLTKYALLRFGVLFNATRGRATLLSTSVSPFLRCLTFWYRANASPFSGPIVAPNPSSAQTAPWPTFRLKLVGGNEGPGVESDTTLLYTLPLQPGAIDGDRWQFRELSIPAVKSHYRVMLEVEIPRRVVAGYVAIDNVAFQARCDAGLHSSYTMWPGNCRGNFIMDWGEPAGCRRCSLEECAVMCDSFSNCDGFSYATGASSAGASFFDYPENYQCYLKSGACSNPVAELPYSYFAKSGRHGASTPQPIIIPETTTSRSPNYIAQRRDHDNEQEDDEDQHRRNDEDEGEIVDGDEDEDREDEDRRRGSWSPWAVPTTTRRMALRWQQTSTTEMPPATQPFRRGGYQQPPPPPPPLPPRIVSMPGSASGNIGGALIIPAVFDDRYEQLDGNCGGNFLFRNGLRVGCQGCSLEECKQLCSKFESTDAQREDGSSSREQYGSRCLGFSFTGRTDVEPRCLLKSMNYCVPSYNTLGYFFYRKVIDSSQQQLPLKEEPQQRQMKSEGDEEDDSMPLIPDFSNTTTL